MKRFFYSLMFVSLAFVQGCQKDEDAETAASVESAELDEMEAAEREAMAIQDLARLLAEEAGAELEMAKLSEADFEKALAELEAEGSSLLAWDDANQFNAVTFDKDSAALSEEQAAVLAANIDSAKEAVEAGNQLLVQGFADELSGEALDEATTLALCTERANAVKNALVEAGIAEDRIQVAAAGSHDSLTWTTATEEAEQLAELAANRRVEIFAA